MKESKPYPQIDNEGTNTMMAQEPSADLAYACDTPDMPEDMDYAHIADGELQVTPDIEDEIADVERGEVISLGEFKTMFAKWL
jgi:hypothetical protein